MPRAVKRKRIIVESDSENDDSNVAARRSSLNVNLSFTSNVSDPGGSDSDRGLLEKRATQNEETPEKENEELKGTVGKRDTKNKTSNDDATPASFANITVINAGNRKACKIKPSKSLRHSVSDMEKIEQQLSKSCIELQNAIINKTNSLLDGELSKKTLKILSGCSSDISQKRQNPVPVNSMSKNTFSEKNDDNDKASQNSDSDGSDYSQSIASTPKKTNIETSVDKSTGETSKQIIKIPVTRLASKFADDNHDNSMSDINSISTPEKIRSNISRDNKANKNSKISRVPYQLNNTVSPILSQGTRKTRISSLSLKRKLIANAAESSRLSTNGSFINRSPLTCSSFIEMSEKTCNSNQHIKTIILEQKSESSENQKTINLDENTKTINIDHSSSQSSMEITTISARTPIIREEFNCNKVDDNKNKKLFISNQPCTNAIDGSIKKAHIPNSVNTDNKEVNEDDCSVNTMRTSLNVNTSLDNVSLAERVMQKENQRPSYTKELVDERSKNNVARSSQTLTTMRSSLCVNTSLDSIRKSSDSSKTDCEQEKRKNMRMQPTSYDNNQDMEKNTERKSNRLSNGTVRFSMHMNTSLDSVQKSPTTQEPLNYNKILSMVEEASCQSPDNDSDTEQMSLLERIQMDGVAKTKKTVNKQDAKEIAETSKGKLDSKERSNTRKSASTTAEKSRDTGKNESKRIRKSNDLKNDDLQKSDSGSIVKRKSCRKSQTNSTKRNSTASESSIVEPTPFPASRSLLFKTIIKNNIAMNTLNPRKLVDSSDDENDGPHLTLSKKTNASPKKRNNVHDKTAILSDDSADTVLVNSSDESSTESNRQKERVVIDESLNDTGNPNKSKINASCKSKKRKVSRNSISSDEEEENRKIAVKRKLYPLRENSQISFSPEEMSARPREPARKEVKRKKRKKRTPKKQESIEKASPEPAETSDETENEISIVKPEKKKKKPRKIKSKKIVVKKVNNMTLLDNMLENHGEASSTNERNSLREFDLRKAKKKACKENYHKIVIVVTGYDKENKDLVKSVVKSLGSATLQANVTPHTTHVISSGVRTINLLKGIIRGCWLLQLKWALKSLESEKWLDPSPYEMSHFAKAVQINRRDRKLFGKAYIPELFITCGPIYIENGTTPPTAALKELVKTAGGSITEDPNAAKIIVGVEGLKENWILDSITTGEVQSFDQYKRN